MMTDPKHLVQPNTATGQTAGNNLTPQLTHLRQARRAAAGFNAMVGQPLHRG
jgi:hypothetical protein